jgi:hypothetical protein
MAFNSNGPIITESVSAVTATPSTDLGTRVTVNGKTYQYVYNAGNSQISPGYGAIVSGVSGYSVTVSSTTSADFCMGFVEHATLTTGTYGWLLQEGFCNVHAAGNVAAAAGALIGLAADGAIAPKTISTGFMGNAVGKAMAAIGSGVSGAAFVRVFGG